MIDVLVAGGGPVGLATAIEAARRGLQVTVAEPRTDPVDKACGEGLMPGAVQRLATLGVHPVGMPITGIRYLAGPLQAEASCANGPGLGVRRTSLHAALTARAAALGVRRLARPVDDIVEEDGWVEAAGERCRWLVAADGLHSPIRRRLGLDRPSRGPRRYGLRAHYGIAPWTSLVEVHWCGDAEAYVTPLQPDLVGIAILGERSKPYPRWLADFPALAERLGGRQPVAQIRGAGPLRQRCDTPRRGRVLFVGDAAGYVDALTGEGITTGLACAEALVDCIVADRPQDYPRAWRRATRRYRLLTGALVHAATIPPLRRHIVPAARRWPRVFALAVDRIGRP